MSLPSGVSILRRISDPAGSVWGAVKFDERKFDWSLASESGSVSATSPSGFPNGNREYHHFLRIVFPVLGNRNEQRPCRFGPKAVSLLSDFPFSGQRQRRAWGVFQVSRTETWLPNGLNLCIWPLVNFIVDLMLGKGFSTGSTANICSGAASAPSARRFIFLFDYTYKRKNYTYDFTCRLCIFCRFPADPIWLALKLSLIWRSQIGPKSYKTSDIRNTINAITPWLF